jgi:hypothetical protein
MTLFFALAVQAPGMVTFEGAMKIEGSGATGGIG